jgi:hypothetical protein
MALETYLVGDISFCADESDLFADSIFESCLLREFCIVQAESKRKAMDKYIFNVGIHDEVFLELVNSKSPSGGILSQLVDYSIIGEHGGSIDHDNFEGEGGRARLIKLVSELFRDKMEFAPILIKYLESNDNKADYPDEILAYMWESAHFGKLNAIAINSFRKI